MQKICDEEANNDANSFCLYHDNETVFEIYESYILTDILSYYVEKYNT